MKISDLFKQTTEANCSALGSVLTLKENLESKLEDITDFINGENPASKLSVLVPYVGDTSTIAEVTQELYDDAFNNPDTEYDIPITSNGDTIPMTGSELVEAIEGQIRDTKIQATFLEYCTGDNDKVSSTEFITRIQGSMSDIAPADLTMYLKCIDMGSSPVEAIKNFFGCTQSVTVSRDSETDVITIVDLADYNGNAWVTAWTNFVDTLEDFFDISWDGIYKIGEFFGNVLQGLIKVGKWLFSQVFGYLFTRYVKVSNSPYGFMDLPLLQVEGSMEQWSEWENNNMVHFYPRDKCYPWNNYCYQRVSSGITGVLQLLSSQTVDQRSVSSITDICIKSDPYDLLLRFGVTNAGNPSLTLYVCFSSEETSVIEDAVIEKNIFLSLANGLKNISAIGCLGSKPQNDIDYANIDEFFSAYADLLLNHNTLTGKLSVDVNASVVGVNILSNGMIPDAEYTDGDPHVGHIIYCLCHYSYAMSKNVFLNDAPLSTLYSPYLPGVHQTGEEVDVFDDNAFNTNVYRPYLKSNLVPCTVHYQTTAEEATEITYTVLAVLLAAAAIIATVKFAKFKKNFTIKKELAQARVDALSWDVSADPSAENIKLYKQARKKNRKMEKWGKMLGLISSESQASVNGNMDSLLDRIIPTNDADVSSTDLSKLLKW